MNSGLSFMNLSFVSGLSGSKSNGVGGIFNNKPNNTMLNPLSKTLPYGKNNSQLLKPEAQYFVKNSVEDAKKLVDIMKDLSGKNKTYTSAFDQKTAVSSNKDLLSINNFTATKFNKLNDKTVGVKINQLATTQVNKGTSLNATDKALSAGYNQFSITTSAGKSYQFSFSASSSDNNRTNQQKMADAINSRNIGVNAKVEYDSTTKKSSLVLESKTTGAEAGNVDKFTVGDVVGSSVSTFGIQNKTQSAGDSQYEEDGVLKTSKTNTVSIANGASVTFKKADPAVVNIEVKKDQTSGINKVREMVNSFNSLLESSANNAKDPKTNKLFNSLVGTATTYASSLRKAGISIQGNGYLKIDEKKMEEAAQSGALKNALGAKDSNFGFSYRVEKLAKQVADKPMSFVGIESYNLGSSGIFGSTGNYSNPFSMNNAFMGMNGGSNLFYNSWF